MKKLLVILFVLMYGWTNGQQLILNHINKLGIGLSTSSTISPELHFSAERHSFFPQYFMYYPAVGCKVRYIKRERGYVYSSAYIASVFAHNGDDGSWLTNFSPDLHIIGFEVYPFEKDFVGVSVYLRTLNFNSVRGYAALLVGF